MPSTKGARWLALAFALALVIAACAGGGPSAPTVVSRSPANDAVAIPVATNVTVTFSRAMDEAATQAAFAIDPAVVCAFSWNPATTVLTCDPSADLAPATLHTVTVATGAESADGVALAAPVTFSFTTAGTGTEPDPAPDACVLGSAVLGTCRLGP